MSSAKILMLIAMIAYLATMVGIGIKFSNKNKTMGDFYLGGRKLGPLVDVYKRQVSDIIVVPNTSSVIMGIGNKSVKTFPLVFDADSLKETNHVLTNWELPFDTVTISGNADAVDRIATVKSTLQGESNEEHATKLSILSLIHI